jgi:15-cis-phytoene synthase
VKAEEAYAEVARVTRRRARNFAYGIMVLPRPKRNAVAAVYAFARRVDDIADGELPFAEKRARLEDLGEALGRDPGEDAVLVALADARARYSIPAEALHALVEGGLQDTEQARYATFDDLLGYCRKVAGAVGLACLPVYGARGSEPQSRRCGPPAAGFGRPAVGVEGDASLAAPPRPVERLERARGSEPQTPRLAEELGVALQLINILRDVAEDWRLGRVYVPLEDLARFDVAEEDLARGRITPAWRALASFEAARARDWLRRGTRLLDRLDRRSALCVGTFAGIYRETLDEIEARGWDVFDGEVRPSAAAKLRIVAGGLLR